MSKFASADTLFLKLSRRSLFDIPIEVVDVIIQDAVAGLIHDEFINIESGNEKNMSYRQIVDKTKTFNFKPILKIANICRHIRAVVVVALARVSVCPALE